MALRIFGTTVFLAAATCFTGVENTCTVLFNLSRMSSATIQVLQDARTNFRIEVRSKIVGFKRKTVILAGEIHIKTNAARQKGLDLS